MYDHRDHHLRIYGSDNITLKVLYLALCYAVTNEGKKKKSEYTLAHPVGLFEIYKKFQRLEMGECDFSFIDLLCPLRVYSG